MPEPIALRKRDVDHAAAGDTVVRALDTYLDLRRAARGGGWLKSRTMRRVSLEMVTVESERSWGSSRPHAM
jgi:hypothetical protein